MPIGPITPGNYVTVTPDVVLAQYSSVQAPTATMPVIGADIQALTLVVLNVQNFCLQESANGLVRKLDKIDGGTVLGDVDFTGDFLVNSGQVHVEPGAIQIGEGTDVITITGSNVDLGSTDLTGGALCNVSFGGTIVFTTTSDVSIDGAGVLHTTNGGKFRWDTRNKTDGDYTANGTNGYEDILPDPAADRTITLANTGAAIGQRKKFNAQNVTAANHWVLEYGARTWFLRNVTGSTVKIEFVYGGSGWIVDDWEEGGVGLRDG